MVLWLGNEEIKQIFTMKDCLAAAEEVYREQGEGRVVNREPPRTHIYLPTSKPDIKHVFKSTDGGLPGFGTQVIRITSDTIGYKLVKGERRRFKFPSIQGGKYYFGLYLLFLNEDGAPLAMLHDGHINHLGVGARVGVGWQAGSCGHCEWCERGEENLCPDDVATAIGHYGGFAQKVIVESRFAFPLPKALRAETAAPLLCGGVTVYSPLRRLVKRGQKVGVIGIGGNGNMALQFARALGYEVTAFSHSPDKEKEAKRFGAGRFVSSTRGSDLAKLARSFDFILVTSYVKLDWAAYLRMLRPDGRLIVAGAVNEPLEIPSGAIISGQKGVVGSVIGSRRMIREMLDFAARHHIEAQTEVFPLEQVNAALDKVRQNKVRYRMVLEVR